MEPNNIHENIMIQFTLVIQHHSFSRKVNMKNYDVQIDVVQNFSRFSGDKQYVNLSK